MDANPSLNLEVPISLRPFVRSSRFRLLGRLGEGGMGTVFRAFDRELGREVALKTMRQPGPGQLFAVKREFRSRAGISHPNLVQLYDLVVGDDFCCFTMEIVDGVDFFRWIRPEGWGGSAGLARERTAGSPLPRGAEPRLRAALAQLVRGLHALHESGHIHRDIKPSNVLVTPQGRAVILDFGLVVELREDEASASAAFGLAGTLPYMSPEQLQGEPLTPASDFYAVGVLLYEALTGVRAFTGDTSSLVRQKLSAPPPDPRAVDPAAPEELAELARALLSPHPSDRPDAGALLARLCPTGRARPAGRPVAPFEPSRRRLRFVGRARELAALAEALREVRIGGQLTVHVRGPSGIGKSTLLRQFLASQGDAILALRSLCHPQESVAYQALDAAIDHLARSLSAQRTREVQPLVPHDAYALVRLFPVLGHVRAFRGAPAPASVPHALELRERGALALRELLTRLARRRPLVIWIDDAQCGDADSASLLALLLRPPDPPPVLLLVSDRAEREGGGGPLLRRLFGEGLLSPASVRELELGPLAPEETAALARQLLSGQDGPLGSVVAQSEGNPFIACELARYVRAGRGCAESTRALDVSRLMLARIEALPEEQRALVEVVAVAGSPLARGVALEGAGLDERARPAITALCDGSLLRQSAGDGAVSVTTYHDRIREAVLAHLGPAERARHHRRLAEALERRGSEDVEALLAHWEGAGEFRRAGGYAVRAADRATGALAFERAAALYEKGLSLLGEAADRPALLMRWGNALANAGRGPEAAARYLEAAAAGSGAEEGGALELRRRAAEQLVKSGRVGEGWQVLSGVLRALNIPVPRSQARALVSALWQRLLFLFASPRRGRPARRPLAEAERQRLEALWTATTSFTLIDHMLADAFRMRHLRRVLAMGDDSAAGRALGYEVSMEAYLGGHLMERRVRKLQLWQARLARRTGLPYDRAEVFAAQAHVAATQGRFRRMAAASQQAEVVLRDECSGVPWEQSIIAVNHHIALAMLGELRELRERLERFTADAELRGDTFAVVESYVGEPVLAWLAADRAAYARERALRALAQQAPGSSAWPEAGYRRQNYFDCVAIIHTALYEGRPERAWEAVLAHWPRLRFGFLPLRFVGVELRHARARAALALAAQPSRGPVSAWRRRWTRRALLADARAQARRIARDPNVMGPPLALLVRAGLAWQQGDAGAARALLARAVEAFDRVDMALHREAARYVLGEQVGGEAGASLRGQALAWMAEQGVQRPRAMVATVAPGLGVLPA